jgi:hypothetical protein
MTLWSLVGAAPDYVIHVDSRSLELVLLVEKYRALFSSEVHDDGESDIQATAGAKAAER